MEDLDGEEESEEEVEQELKKKDKNGISK